MDIKYKMLLNSDFMQWYTTLGHTGRGSPTTTVGASVDHLEFLQLLIEGGQVMCLLQLGWLALQVGQLAVQVRVALDRRLRLVVLKELPRLGLCGPLQVGPALPDLLQLLLHHRPQLWLLLDQVLALLERHRGTCRTMSWFMVHGPWFMVVPCCSAIRFFRSSGWPPR